MKKLNSKIGMTLVEMLCAVLIMLLVSAGLVVGVSLAVRNFEKSLAMSEAQILSSTLQTTVSDELRYSGTLFYDNKGVLTGFFSQNHGGDKARDGFITDADGQVTLGADKLLPKKSYPHGLRASVTIDGFDGTTKLFSVTVTVSDRTGGELSRTEFKVKKLNISAGETLEIANERAARARDISNAEKLEAMLLSMIESGRVTFPRGTSKSGIWVLVTRDTTTYPSSYGNRATSFYAGADKNVVVDGEASKDWNVENNLLRDKAIECLGGAENIKVNSDGVTAIDGIKGWDWYVVEYLYDPAQDKYQSRIFSGFKGGQSAFTIPETNLEKYMKR